MSETQYEIRLVNRQTDDRFSMLLFTEPTLLPSSRQWDIVLHIKSKFNVPDYDMTTHLLPAEADCMFNMFQPVRLANLRVNMYAGYAMVASVNFSIELVRKGVL